MRYAVYRLVYLIVLLLLSNPICSQSIMDFERKSIVEASSSLLHQVELIDSMQTKRGLLSTNIYQNSDKLKMSVVQQKLQNFPNISKKLRWANILKPLGPLMIVSGIFICYSGIKGVKETDTVRGIRPPGVNEVPDVLVEYTRRSVPKVLGGLGLFVGGICLIEASSEITAKSITLYNNKLKLTTRKPSVTSVKFGITSNGYLGFESKF